MGDISERGVVERAKILGQLEPPGGSAEHAMLAARAVLRVRERGANTRRWILRGTMAAGLAIATLAGVVVFSRPRTVSAAEALQEVVASQEGYKGWIHMTAKQGYGANASTTRQHIDTAGKTVVTESESRGSRFVTIMLPKQGIVEQYVESTGEIRLQELGPPEWAPLNSYTAPVTLEEIIQNVRLALHTIKPDVRQSKDGEWEKFEVTAGAQVASDGPPEAIRVVKVTVWVDPGTKLVMKEQTEIEPQQVRTIPATALNSVVAFSYGAPAMEDIYSAGVPRSAVVVDMRPDAATRAALGKVRGILAPTLGDYVAVLTETSRSADGKPGNSGRVNLYGRHGNRFFEREYSVAAKELRSDEVYFDLPKGWPEPTAADMAAAVAGKMATRIRTGIPSASTRWELDLQTKQYKRSLVGRATEPVDVFSNVFTDRWEIMSLDVNAQAKLIEDAGHPGLKGLQTESLLSTQKIAGRPASTQQGPRPGSGEDQAVKVWWLDPAQGYAPAAYERPVMRISAGSDIPRKQWLRVTKFEEYGKLGDGTAYPTRWSEESPPSPAALRMGAAAQDQVIEHRLRIEQRVPEAAWFDEPKIEK